MATDQNTETKQLSTAMESARTAAENDEDPRLVQANKLFQTGVMLIYGPRKSVDKAIKCIQRAITFNDSDYKYWQFLGEAYYQRGSLNPAINCFMKSLNLAEIKEGFDELEQRRRLADSTYSRLRMSDIRLSVGHLDEAALGYSNIVSEEPNNVAALVGLARAELQLARNSFSSGLVVLGHVHCMKALKFSLRIIKISPHLCLTWKLASDCCLIQFVDGQRGQFAAKIDEKFPGGDDGSLMIDRKTCIDLAQQFLCKALAIEPFDESGCLWHNLGISLYLKSTLVQKPDEREILLKRSIKCLLKALDYDRKNSQIKNSIGVVAFHLNLLNTAQSFLIKSIQSNMSTSEIQFSNLGYMYLQKGEFRLASVAFSRCQAEEPLYSRSWLGNALLNEQNNSDNLSLLRHCHRLENNYESQLMYATKVSSSSSNECNRDLVNALDCMKRMINYDQNSLEANNTLGLLYERSNYRDQAKLCFEKAYSISPQDSRVIINKLRQYRASNSCFSTDSACNPSDDVDFIKSAEKLTLGSNQEYLLNFIFFLFKNGDYKGVNLRMTKFMDKLSQDDVPSKISAQILLGLAARAEGCDFKSWLFKNIIDLENINCIETVINLLCLLLLGAIANEQQLVEQISSDLAKHLLTYVSTKASQFTTTFYSMEGYWLRFAIFCSIFCLKDQSKLIRPFLALFPTIAELWLYLGLALMFEKTKYQTAVFCIQKANLIGSSHADLGVICDVLLAILAQVTKMKTNSSLGSRANCLSRAIYRSPNYGLLWKLLMSPQIINDKTKKSQLLSEDNSSLFNLAIDHVIRIVISSPSQQPVFNI